MLSLEHYQLNQRLASTAALVLTANNRLARTLAVDYDHWMQNAGVQAWRKPSILPFESWCRDQASRLFPACRWLSPWQELRLWEEVIAASPEAEQHRLQIPALARQAQAAHRLLVQYQVSDPPDWPLADYRVFLGWRQAWQQALVEHGFRDSCQLPVLLAERVQAGREGVPTEVILAGFDDLRPDQRLLLDSFRAAGSSLLILQEPRAKDPRQQLLIAADPEAEVRSAARWARSALQQGASRIGIVATDLAVYQPLIERIFRSELQPGAALLGSEGDELPFSLSLGVPLASEGVVSAALQLLRLGRQVTTRELSRLLNSPFVGDRQVPLTRRSQLDVRLRKSGQPHWSWTQLRRFDPLFADHETALGRLATACLDQGHGHRLSAGDWALRFAHTLAACHWPGEGPLDSRAWQAVESFRDLLVRMASLDAVSQPLERSEAVGLLQRLTREQTFQPESNDGPILVTGLLESTGLQFQRLWLLGMHDGIFPAPPRPNPFLPLPLQRNLGMPHADADRELAFCARLSERLFQAAPGVVASFPARVDDLELAASPFVAGWEAAAPELADSVDPLQLVHLQRPLLETLEDARARPLNSRKAVTGGTTLLKDQALCPFRAFAHHRLRVEGLEDPDLGLDHRARGILVHALLEHFWRQTADHATLVQLTPNELQAGLHQAAEQALAQFEAREKRSLPVRLRLIEARRLVDLGTQWLALEAQRSPFSVMVEALEKLQTVQIGALQIRTRIDRIDALAGGGVAVLDYKTGQPDPRQWFEARLTEPQLPLYTLDLAEGELAAVVFAGVRRGGCQFRGLVSGDELFPRLPERAVRSCMEQTGFTSLEALRKHWRGSLEQLAADFLAGEARVDPVDAKTACRTCDLASLCRIAEIENQDQGEMP